MEIERVAFQKYLKEHGWHWAREIKGHIQYKKSGEDELISLDADRTISIGVLHSALRRMKISNEQFRREFFGSAKKKKR